MPCTLSFSPHVQRNAGFHVLLCPDTVEALLHLAIMPIAPFPRIRRREQQFVIEKNQRLFQCGRKKILEALTEIKQCIDLLHDLA